MSQVFPLRDAMVDAVLVTAHYQLDTTNTNIGIHELVGISLGGLWCDIRVVGNMENRTAMMFNDDFNPVSAALMCQNNVMLMPNSV